MAKTLRPISLIALIALALLPLAWVTGSAVLAGLDVAAWQYLLNDPALTSSLLLSLWTGLASTCLAYALSMWLISRLFMRTDFQHQLQRLNVALGPMLAMPHAALAIGLVFLLSPSGWLLRLFSPWLTGFDFPPAWQTTQDPLGLGLIAALVAKETPFLLWNALTQLARADVQKRWQQEFNLAQTLGYGPTRAYWRVIGPQLAKRMRWPLLAVLAYGLTVVDMAIVIGPASPPTFSVLAWQWLQTVDESSYQQGAAAALLLALCLLLVMAAMAIWWRVSKHARTRVNGERAAKIIANYSTNKPDDGLFLPALYAGIGVYALLMLVLLVSSVSGIWPFPELWPQSYTAAAWQNVWASSRTVWTTLGLALASSSMVLLWSVAWLELAPPAWDDAFRKFLYLPLLMPSVLWVIGLHRMTLFLGVDAQWLGLLLAHAMAVLPYVTITLAPAYLGFDARYAQLSASLGHKPIYFLIHVKWPLLRASLASAFAVGFAVSVAQYLPTLFVGAGRFSTVTTEAVTMASGGQRSLTAAYAWLQFVLPLLCFGVAARFGRARQFKQQRPA